MKCLSLKPRACKYTEGTKSPYIHIHKEVALWTRSAFLLLTLVLFTKFTCYVKTIRVLYHSCEKWHKGAVLTLHLNIDNKIIEGIYTNWPIYGITYSKEETVYSCARHCIVYAGVSLE